LLENSLLQAPSSSLQNKREERSTNQQGNEVVRQQGNKAQGSETTIGGGVGMLKGTSKYQVMATR
jgi:hypothetical protein